MNYYDYEKKSSTVPTISFKDFSKNEADYCDPTHMEKFNCSIQQYLQYSRGMQQQTLNIAIPVTIIYTTIFVSGVIGNLMVCFVIVKNASMHTATNYYLFSLAVSDLIFLILGLPYELSLVWHQYPFSLGIACCKLRALIAETSTNVSVLTIVAFSMERYLAICHPLHLHTMSGIQRPIRIIAVIWVVSFISALPFAVFFEIDLIRYPKDNSTIPESAFCTILQNPPGLWEISSCVFFVIPMIVMVAMYGKMGLRIRTRSSQTSALGIQRGSMQRESQQAQSRRIIIRMLATVVIAFFLCWAPYHFQRLSFLYWSEWEHYSELNEWIFFPTGVLYYFSCTINPILYNLMSNRYRMAFRETLCRKRGSYYQNNRFSREQSSFRETTIGGTVGQENSQLIRGRLIMVSNRYSYHKDHISANNSGNIQRPSKKNELREQIPPVIDETQPRNFGCNDPVEVVIVEFDHSRPKCYTTHNFNLNNDETVNNVDNMSVSNFIHNTSKVETYV